MHVFEYICEHVDVRTVSDRGRSGFDLNPRGLISSQLSGTLSTQTTVLKVVRAPYGTGELCLPLHPSTEHALETRTPRHKRAHP